MLFARGLVGRIAAVQQRTILTGMALRGSDHATFVTRYKASSRLAVGESNIAGGPMRSCNRTGDRNRNRRSFCHMCGYAYFFRNRTDQVVRREITNRPMKMDAIATR